MESCEPTNIMCKDLFTDGDVLETPVQDLEFYTPLSKTGYLTPLQRKKLREKRKLDFSSFVEDSNPKPKKRKKDIPFNVKNENRLKKNKCSVKKVVVPNVQFNISSVLRKTSENYPKKKFFKTVSSSRFKNANFTMPLTSFNKSNLSLCTKHSVLNKPGSFSNFKSYQKMSSNSSSLDNLIKMQHSDILAVSNPEDAIFNFEWPDNFLLERQAKARLLCRETLNVLKTTSRTTDECSATNIPSAKLYPVFEFTKNKKKINLQSNSRNKKCIMKCVKSFSKGAEQMIIDAGQQEIGPKVCSTCDMLYNIGQAEDEKLHSDYHTLFLINLKFLGWKEENIIGNYCDGRVIMVQKNDTYYKLKKIEDVLLIVNRDLGFPISGLPPRPDVTFVLFISNEKCVAGCLVAEPISCGYKVLLAECDSENNIKQTKSRIWRSGNWYSSSKSSPAVCGVSRIWVSKKYRRCKVASRMLDCLRCNFIHGHIVSLQEIAFTDPSLDGREFAVSYTGTNNFLVYK